MMIAGGPHKRVLRVWKSVASETEKKAPTTQNPISTDQTSNRIDDFRKKKRNNTKLLDTYLTMSIICSTGELLWGRTFVCRTTHTHRRST